MSCKMYDPELFQKNWYPKKKISNNILTYHNDKFLSEKLFKDLLLEQLSYN